MEGSDQHLSKKRLVYWTTIILNRVQGCRDNMYLFVEVADERPSNVDSA
jgi:hypothetical protein